MKATLALAVLVVVALADSVPAPAPTYGWLKKHGIPLGEMIRKAEEGEDLTRIFNGQTASLGQFPHQVGIIIEFRNISSLGVCGGSLVSINRVLTAAHCWFDGVTQAFRLTSVLGSVRIFSDGTRVVSSDVTMHENWSPLLARYDIAIVRLPINIVGDYIAPIALPSGTALNELFVGETAIASGFGRVREGQDISSNQILSWANFLIISNAECAQDFPSLIVHNNLCVSTTGGSSPCRGDSGGPLTLRRNNQPLLVGVNSFGHIEGCESRRPAVFARVSSFMDFIRNNM